MAESEQGVVVASEALHEDALLSECAALGCAVLAAQRVEFLFYGLVAHFRDELKKDEAKFRGLTPEGFLRGDLANLRATLGQLARTYGKTLGLSPEELERFVKNRNLIVHDYWRLTKSDVQGAQTLGNPISFLQQFVADCRRWEEILMGVLATMKLEIVASNRGAEPPELTAKELSHMVKYILHSWPHLPEE